MKEIERDALAELTAISWALSRDGVWEEPKPHIAGLNGEALRTVMSGFDSAKASAAESPIGVVVTGRAGSGKTHLVATVRSRVVAAGGYFFALDLRHERAFWQRVVHDVLSGLLRPGTDGVPQGEILRRGLSRRLDLPEPLHRQLMGQDRPTRSGLDAVVEALDRVDPQLAFECGHTLRAVVLLASRSVTTREVATAYLSAEDEAVAGERAEWGIRAASRKPHETVGELFRLIALTGPSVIALDQLDTLIRQSDQATDNTVPVGPDAAVGTASDPVTSAATSPAAANPATSSIGLPRREAFEDVGSGLMELREVTRRALVLVACMDPIWQGITEYAPGSVAQRFRRAEQLDTIPTAAVGKTLIERRFALKFRKVGFTPPYPTWPVRPEAFAEAVRFTARGLIRRIDTHLQACLAADELVELTRLTEPDGAGLDAARSDTARPDGPGLGGAGPDGVALPGAELPGAETPAPRPSPAPPSADEDELAELDRQLNALVSDADVVGEIARALDPRQEDRRMPDLMRSALTWWTTEQGTERFRYELPPATLAAGNPTMHAELHRTLDETTEDKIFWSFRSIAWRDGRAVINRIDRFVRATGLDPLVPKRKAYLLRTGEWSTGHKTRQKVQEFEAAGGVVIGLSRETLESGLRTFAALERLARTQPSARFQTWLLSRRPAGRTALLRTVFGDPPDTPQPVGPAAARPDSTAPVGTAPDRIGPDVVGPGSAAPGRPATDPVVLDPMALHLGIRMDTGAPVSVTLESLRKHTAIFAGSGSGKTVLIRRLVEECALRGVSAIVLDPNNDLARLGDPWPRPPQAWGPDDAARADDYLRNTDVVVWTPRRETGRPLAFRPLPDFAAVADDPDEFRQAIDTAVAAIAPRVRADGGTVKAERSRAVLNEALQYFARAGGGGLSHFLDLLGDLPDGVAQLAQSQEMAADMAQTLCAAMINDPLFGGVGEPVDPGVLLTPAAGKRARISVISLVGLPTEEQRQSFVNQLQMALFAWIKRHPAGDRPLGGLLVVDEAQTIAPSGALTASTHSTLALASQARKYGLGLVFATQAPRGIHNRISGNAATQLFGFLNSPPQIAAAKEMAAAKSSAVPDISRLGSGQFYAVAEGLAFQKIRTPICLSHHPSSPLTVEEVIDRARRD
ncbi:helicase HerA domain-containing protein [Promicromonospora sp. MS192]|uniref:ATP-binding protein n=1 Tax=Promicromonospora sp. MS192 TaxID=3412684 RepID=UPI003C306503